MATEEEVTSVKYLHYFLYNALGGAFSVHDVLPSMQTFNVCRDAILIWLKGIKRILLVIYKINATDVIELDIYLKRCFSDALNC